MTNKYDWQPGMQEISGFGEDGKPGGVAYEQACRDMVRAGCEWLDAHPDAKPAASESPNVFGVIREANDETKQLVDTMCNACPNGGASGAMVHATLRAVLFVHHNGWERYVAEMSRRRN